MKKILISLGFMLIGLMIFAVPVLAKGGFDEFGYNRTARNFVGTCVSWHMGKFGSDIAGAEAYCGPYSYDKLVMKWNAEWDRGNSEGWSDPNGYDAWLNNEWNGKMPGSSGSVWHYKIAWDEGCSEDGVPSTDGGYCIWTHFVVLMDQGIDPSLGPGHFWFALGIPNGYGAY